MDSPPKDDHKLEWECQGPLPRLIYIAEVPVERTVAGALLLYRLLQHYPKEKLQVWQTTAGDEKLRLHGVEYFMPKFPLARLRHSRFAGWHTRFVHFSAFLLARALWRRAEAFRPEAVLTVTNGDYWSVAAALAQLHNLPLHLICHDDTSQSFSSLRRPWRKEDPLSATYRMASSRLCVSSPMEETYERRFGVRGTVMLPSRGTDCPKFDDVPERLHGKFPAPRVAYAGSLHSAGYLQALQDMAEALQPLGGSLWVYGRDGISHADTKILNAPNVKFQGFVPSEKLLHRLRAEADFLYLPMSFEPSQSLNMRLSFPSKLADYTAIGLPILIFGPPECSAVRWALNHPGAAVVVSSDDSRGMEIQLKELISNPSRCLSLARKAMEAGAKDFSSTKAWKIFSSALTRSFQKPLLGRAQVGEDFVK